MTNYDFPRHLFADSSTKDIAHLFPQGSVEVKLLNTAYSSISDYFYFYHFRAARQPRSKDKEKEIK